MSSAVLEKGRTPEEWVAEFAQRGIPISARALRFTARKTGACRMFGKTMIIMPEHIDTIFQEPSQCHSHTMSEMDGGGSKAGSTGYRAANTTDKALAYLQRQTKAKSSGQSRDSKIRRSNVITLARKGP